MPADSLIETRQFYTNAQGLHIANADAFYEQNPQDQYPYCINSQGFRTTEFNATKDTSQLSVMLIGDSFAWGGGAQPISRSFADLLDQYPRYQCINTGIPGVDPAQYAEIARRFIPQIKPDIVCCVFFTGNDLVYYPRPISPNYQLFYWTNAGALTGYPPQWPADTTSKPFASAQESYQFIVNHYTLWNNKHNPVKKCCAKFCTTTLLWYSLSQLGNLSPKQWFRQPISAQYLKQIEQLAQQNNAAFILLLIPTIDEADLPAQTVLKRYQSKLPHIPLNLPPTLNSDAYLPLPNGHLNNTGHRVYAQYLIGLLDSLTSNKVPQTPQF